MWNKHHHGDIGVAAKFKFFIFLLKNFKKNKKIDKPQDEENGFVEFVSSFNLQRRKYSQTFTYASANAGLVTLR